MSPISQWARKRALVTALEMMVMVMGRDRRSEVEPYDIGPCGCSHGPSFELRWHLSPVSNARVSTADLQVQLGFV